MLCQLCSVFTELEKRNGFIIHTQPRPGCTLSTTDGLSACTGAGGRMLKQGLRAMTAVMHKITVCHRCRLRDAAVPSCVRSQQLHAAGSDSDTAPVRGGGGEASPLRVRAECV